MRLNGLRNVLVVDRAVGPHCGEARVTTDSNARIIAAGKGGRSVAMVPLDAYAHLRPTMLKIDVEGFEVEVLRGAARILETRPKLAIELHAPALPTFGNSVEELFALYDFSRAHTHIDTGDAIEPYHGDLSLDRRCHIFALPREPRDGPPRSGPSLDRSSSSLPELGDLALDSPEFP